MPTRAQHPGRRLTTHKALILLVVHEMFQGALLGCVWGGGEEFLLAAQLMSFFLLSPEFGGSDGDQGSVCV